MGKLLTGSAGTSTRRMARGGVVVVVAALLTGGLTACRPHAQGCEPGAGRPDIPRHSPWARHLCRQADQHPPVLANGIVYRDGVLWIASLSTDDRPGEHEIVAADADTGEILGRFGPDQGVTSRPDDLVMTRRGTIYWTGSNGDIGVLRPDGRTSTLTNVGPGANPIVLGPDRELYVGRFYFDLTGIDPQPWSGLYRIDPGDGATTVINPDVQINAFAFGSDGQIYAPGELTPSPSRLLRIDPATGQTTEIPAGFDFYAPSVRFPPRSRGDAPTTAYVLSTFPHAFLRRLDIRTGQPVAPDIVMPFDFVDNMTFAPDGRLFVTGFNAPAVAVVGVDGSIRTLPMGEP